MPVTRDSLEEFKRQLEKGIIQEAYRAIHEFLLALRVRYERKLSESGVSSLYPGQLNMSYFAIFPPQLRQRNLKIAIVFNYEEFRFEAWLAARNREVQRQFWKRLKDVPTTRYRLVTPGKEVDSILECDLASGFDLENPDQLTATIEKRVKNFLDDLDEYLRS